MDSLFCVSAILGNPPTLSEPPQHEKKIHEHKGILRHTLRLLLLLLLLVLLRAGPNSAFKRRSKNAR